MIPTPLLDSRFYVLPQYCSQREREIDEGAPTTTPLPHHHHPSASLPNIYFPHGLLQFTIGARTRAPTSDDRVRKSQYEHCVVVAARCCLCDHIDTGNLREVVLGSFSFHASATTVRLNKITFAIPLVPACGIDDTRALRKDMFSFCSFALENLVPIATPTGVPMVIRRQRGSLFPLLTCRWFLSSPDVTPLVREEGGGSQHTSSQLVLVSTRKFGVSFLFATGQMYSKRRRSCLSLSLTGSPPRVGLLVRGGGAQSRGAPRDGRSSDHGVPLGSGRGPPLCTEE